MIFAAIVFGIVLVIAMLGVLAVAAAFAAAFIALGLIGFAMIVVGLILVLQDPGAGLILIGTGALLSLLSAAAKAAKE